MSLLESLKLRARVRPQRIVLPEGEDRRVVAAAVQVVREGYASVTLLGREHVIRAVAAEARDVAGRRDATRPSRQPSARELCTHSPTSGGAPPA